MKSLDDLDGLLAYLPETAQNEFARTNRIKEACHTGSNGFDITRIVHDIAWLCKEGEIEIQDILNQLHTVDWNVVIRIVKEEHSERINQLVKKYTDFLESYKNCPKCNKTFKVKELFEIKAPYVAGTFSNLKVCKACLPTIYHWNEKKCKANCLICGQEVWSNYPLFCSDHLTDFNKKELARIRGQNHRTAKLNLPSTLTLREWIDLIETYNHKCAYCKYNQFIAMDHIVPVSRGGGTTVENVLPVCKRCNSAKHNNYPETVNGDRFF